jgi:hypothetical protein
VEKALGGKARFQLNCWPSNSVFVLFLYSFSHITFQTLLICSWGNDIQKFNAMFKSKQFIYTHFFGLKQGWVSLSLYMYFSFWILFRYWIELELT